MVPSPDPRPVRGAVGPGRAAGAGGAVAAAPPPRDGPSGLGHDRLRRLLGQRRGRDPPLLVRPGRHHEPDPPRHRLRAPARRQLHQPARQLGMDGRPGRGRSRRGGRGSGLVRGAPPAALATHAALHLGRSGHDRRVPRRAGPGGRGGPAPHRHRRCRPLALGPAHGAAAPGRGGGVLPLLGPAPLRERAEGCGRPLRPPGRPALLLGLARCLRHRRSTQGLPPRRRERPALQRVLRARRRRPGRAAGVEHGGGRSPGPRPSAPCRRGPPTGCPVAGSRSELGANPGYIRPRASRRKAKTKASSFHASYRPDGPWWPAPSSVFR